MGIENLQENNPIKKRESERNEDTGSHIENPNLKKEFGELLEKCETSKHQVGLHLINTRLWIDELSKKYQRPITIDTIPDTEWEELFEQYDMFWFMGIYAPSEASKNHAKRYADQYRYALPDIDREKDVAASPFAIPQYSPNAQIAKDWNSWDTMEKKLNERKKKVIVDFVPNHTALDHPWTKEHPEYYILGTQAQYEASKNFYYSVVANDGKTHYIAHGKDPNYPEWADTLQLNYATPAVQEKMRDVLSDLIEHADGVRCDMAMLLNSGTFIRTWGWCLSTEQKRYITQHEFWEHAIPSVKSKAMNTKGKDFYFIAEAYWDKEELGNYFDYIYGKDFYDHLKKIAKDEISPDGLRSHIKYLITSARKDRHYKDVLFIENHDEERAVKTFGEEASKAASVLAGLIPHSIFLINQGQMDGREIRPPMQTNRWPEEPPRKRIRAHYEKLLSLKHTNLFQNGDWKMADIHTLFPGIQAVKVEVTDTAEMNKKMPEFELGTVILTNFSKSEADCRIPQITNDYEIEVQSMVSGVIANPDMERNGGLYIKLRPWETQIVFYYNKRRGQSFTEALSGSLESGSSR